jgi:FKBP-type peptidyl-prolyl cis-trans isomerase
MRRIAAALFVPLIAAAALAGCGSSKSPTAASPNAAVSASGPFDKAPVVKIPTKKAGSNLAVKTEISGNGPALGKTDAFVGNYVVYIWSGAKNKLALSTYTQAPQVLSGTLLPGLETALRGKKMGSRVLAVLPPKFAYGKTGNSQVGVSATDTLVFVVDMIKDFPATASASGTQVSNGGNGLPKVTAAPGSAPTVKVPSTSPPTKLVVKTLIKGSGAALTKGQEVITQYVGVLYRTGKTFDSSWSRGAPFGFQLDANPAQIIPGWDKGLVGVPIGSRVMLVIPPADGYGKAGNSSAGIKGTDTLVFVVDILGAVGGSAA